MAKGYQNQDGSQAVPFTFAFLSKRNNCSVPRVLSENYVFFPFHLGNGRGQNPNSINDKIQCL